MASLEPAPVIPEGLRAEPFIDGPRRQRSRWGLYGFALAVVALIGVVAVLLLTRPTPAPVVEPPSIPPPIAEAVTVAVDEVPPVVASIPEPVVVAPAATARVTSPVKSPVTKAPAPPQPISPEPQAEPALPPQIVVEAPPAGAPPTPARRQSDDPNAPIITQPQPLND